MNRLAIRRTERCDRPGAYPARRTLLHAGVVAVHAVLVPYHLTTEVHLHRGSVPSHHAAGGVHDHLGAHGHDHGHGHDENHLPHAAADHDREGTRPESCDRAVAAARDGVVPGEVAMPSSVDGEKLADPGPLIPPQGTRLGPRRIRGPPPA